MTEKQYKDRLAELEAENTRLKEQMKNIAYSVGVALGEITKPQALQPKGEA